MAAIKLKRADPLTDEAKALLKSLTACRNGELLDTPEELITAALIAQEEPCETNDPLNHVQRIIWAIAEGMQGTRRTR